MFYQNAKTNRRKFLERSALGAGSVLFSSMLLGGCTDHLIPGETKPPTVPALTNTETDWNDDAKAVVSFGLGMIPEAGEVLSLLVDIFWPNTQEDVWGEVKAQVEALVNQQIAADVYNRVQGNLDGLKNVTANYLNAIHNDGDVKTNWINLRNDFALYQPNFQQAGDELLLLPLFGQFANMYLSVLRDAVLHGSDWGMAPGDLQQAAKDLTQYISDFSNYVSNTYSTNRSNLLQATPRDNHACEPFRTVNTFDRQMTLTVLNFMDTWPYFDATAYPNGSGETMITLSREVYSDPYGSCVNSGDIVIASPAPTQRPTSITVWAWDRLDGVQVTYPNGSGPGGVTQTKRMGDQYGGSSQTHGGVVPLSLDNPIIGASTTYNQDVPFTLQFVYADYTTSPVFGGNAGWGTNGSGTIGYLYHALTSIHVNGVNEYYGSADSIVFGYKYWKSPALTSSAVQAIYVKSPKERTAAEFAKVLPSFIIPANLITEELKVARAAYWASIEARAK